MPVKVSVIVPVYNTGPDIEGNIDSMLEQTLSADEYEVIYIDDGSTDDTPDRLEKLSVDHPQVRVIRIPASGWPGRPRNVGVANARGEFVQFLDDDDFMAPDALRRLYELGDRSGADIVVGKMASNFSGIPHRAFKRTREAVNVLEDRELMSLTGHKMFRRSFIDEHGLRFHEGKWLGEDLAFVAEAYCRTEKVSFLADYTCYYWWARTQGAHGSGGQRDRRIWFDHIGTIVRTVKDALPAGRPRDMLLGRLYSVEVLAEVQRRVGSDDPEDGYPAWFEQARAMAGELMPASVGPTLEYFERISALLFERGDAEALAEWTRFRAGVAHEVRFGSAAWAADGALEVGFTARLVHRGDAVRPLRFVREGGRVLLEPESAERFGLPSDVLDVTAEFDRHRVDLALQHRETRVRWWSRCDAERIEEPLPDGGFAVGFRCAGRLQTEAEDGHGRPGKGLWDAHVGVLGFGVTRGGRFGADREPGVDWSTGPALLGSPARAVVPYYTNPVGQLTIDVGATAKQAGVYLAGRGPWRLAGTRGTPVDGQAAPRPGGGRPGPRPPPGGVAATDGRRRRPGPVVRGAGANAAVPRSRPARPAAVRWCRVRCGRGLRAARPSPRARFPPGPLPDRPRRAGVAAARHARVGRRARRAPTRPPGRRHCARECAPAGETPAQVRPGQGMRSTNRVPTPPSEPPLERRPAAMTVEVTVVVAVRNGAGFMDECVRSLLRQTMPADAFEVLFIDDGSTDDSVERIERDVSGRPQFQVVRSEHSGSYGAPRNLGLDRARGEFVLFLDEDDHLGPDALRRLCEFATANDADIVQPLLVSGFPEAAHPVYRRTLGRCSLADADLAWALTDHQLFRRSFLAEHGLRFDEGKRLMADAAFVAEAYGATDRIAVYADYPCYHWRSRHHAARGAGGLHGHEAWFGHVAALADTFTSRLPGPARDRALGRVYEADVHAQLLRRIDWADPGQGFDAWYEEARKTLAAHMPSAVGSSSGVFTRVASALLEHGDRDRLVEWYRLMRTVRTESRLERAEWGADGALELDCTARLVWADGAPVRFVRVADRVFLDRSLAERFGVDTEILDVTGEFATHTGALSVAHREEGLRWPCPAAFEQVLRDDADGLSIAFNVTGAVPTEASDGRERLSRGLWDVHIELFGFGLSRGARLGADRAFAAGDLGPAVLGSPARGVIPFFTTVKGELTIDVGKKARALANHLSGRGVEPVDGALLIDAATAPSTAETGSKLLVEDGAGDWYEVAVTMRPFEGRWRLEPPRAVPGLAPGEGRLFVGLDPGDVPPLPLGEVRIGPDGALSVSTGRR